MKQLIVLFISSSITLSSFASVKPALPVIKTAAIKSVLKKENTLSVNLKAAGKISISWVASLETTTSSYQIQKSINGGQFKTIALLMGESNESYTYKDNVKDTSGNIIYKVILVDNNTAVKVITQSIVLL